MDETTQARLHKTFDELAANVRAARDSEDDGIRAYWNGVWMALACYERATGTNRWGFYVPTTVDTDPYFDDQDAQEGWSPEALAFERMGERMSAKQPSPAEQVLDSATKHHEGLIAEAEYAAEHAPGYVMIGGSPYPHQDLSSATIETILQDIGTYYDQKHQEWEKFNQATLMTSETAAVEKAYETMGPEVDHTLFILSELHDRYYELALCTDERLHSILDILAIIREVVEHTPNQ